MTKPYRLLYADPPRRFEVRDRKTGLRKSPDRHYRTMTTEQLCALPVERLAAKDALLVMWVYDPLLPSTFDIAQAWGFPTFVTVLFRWIKTTKGGSSRTGGVKLNFGTGYHTRGGGCEEAFLFRRGRGCPVKAHDVRKEFFSPVREHSRKPDEVRGMIERLYGDLPRVELFARTRTKGWATAHSDQRGMFR